MSSEKWNKIEFNNFELLTYNETVKVEKKTLECKIDEDYNVHKGRKEYNTNNNNKILVEMKIIEFCCVR